MSRSVYSTLFAATSYTTTGNHTVYTVPSGFVAVLKDVTAFEYSGSGRGLLYDVTNGQSWTLWINSSGDYKPFEWQGMQVFPAGSQMGFTLVSGAFQLRYNGYLLAA